MKVYVVHWWRLVGDEDGASETPEVLGVYARREAAENAAAEFNQRDIGTRSHAYVAEKEVIE